MRLWRKRKRRKADLATTLETMNTILGVLCGHYAGDHIDSEALVTMPANEVLDASLALVDSLVQMLATVRGEPAEQVARELAQAVYVQRHSLPT